MSVLLVIKEDEAADTMVQWGHKMVCSGGDLRILKISDGVNVGEVVWEGETKESLAFQDQEEVKVIHGRVETLNVVKTVLGQVKSWKPSLVILQDQVRYPDHYRSALKVLMEDVSCAVMVLRLGESASGIGRVLLPCAGGPHSKAGLKIAAQTMGVAVTALFVEPDVDEVSAAVGEKHLTRYIKRAGVPVDSVDLKIILSSDVSGAIKNELSGGEYGLLLIGASGAGTLRRKLFGTVPGRLMKGNSSMSVGVIRGARPMGHRVREHVERLMHLNVPQLNRDERVALFNEVEEKARWSFDFAALMMMATAIASLGLLANSGAVVIGAMLVAPLMTPLLGGGLALVQGNWPLWRNCQRAVIYGFFSALGIGLLMGFGARMLSFELTDELAVRGVPSILDLGVAFVSGIAASYCLARPKLSGALAGVAIAAALVPPIATTGICLAMGKYVVAQGAGLLFGTNVVAIVIGSALNFFIAGIRGQATSAGGWAKRMAILFALIMAGLVVPLSSALVSKIANASQVESVISQTGADLGVKVTSVQKLKYKDGIQVIEIVIEDAEPVKREVVSQLQRVAETALQEEVKIIVVTRLVIEGK